jgi:hypothetical protein
MAGSVRMASAGQKRVNCTGDTSRRLPAPARLAPRSHRSKTDFSQKSVSRTSHMSKYKRTADFAPPRGNRRIERSQHHRRWGSSAHGESHVAAGWSTAGPVIDSAREQARPLVRLLAQGSARARSLPDLRVALGGKYAPDNKSPWANRSEYHSERKWIRRSSQGQATQKRTASSNPLSSSNESVPTAGPLRVIFKVENPGQ